MLYCRVFWKSSRHSGHWRCFRIRNFSWLCITETEDCRGRSQCCFIQLLRLIKIISWLILQTTNPIVCQGMVGLVDKQYINRGSSSEIGDISHYRCIVLSCLIHPSLFFQRLIVFVWWVRIPLCSYYADCSFFFSKWKSSLLFCSPSLCSSWLGICCVSEYHSNVAWSFERVML